MTDKLRPAVKLAYSLGEAAHETSCSERKLRREIAGKRLQATRRGRRVIIPHEALLAWINGDGAKPVAA